MTANAKKSTISLIVVLATACLLPWLFGGTHATVKVATSIILLVVLAGTFLLRNAECRATQSNAIWLLLLAFAMLTLVQLLPLPTQILHLLSPVGKSTSVYFLPAATRDFWRPITLDVGLTLEELAFVALLTGFALCLVLLLKRVESTRIAFAMLSINGAATAFFGIAQKLASARSLYQVVPLDGGHFAAYLNRNAAAGYLNICLGASIAWFAMTLSNNDEIPAQKKPSMRYRAASWPRLYEFLEAIRGESIVALVCMAFCAAGVVATASRGGMLSAVAALACLAICLLIQRRFQLAGWLLAGGLGLTLVIVLALGLHGEIQRRVQQKAAGDRPEGRLVHWSYMLNAIPDYWRLGAGVGTYRYVHRLYDTQSSSKWYYHAENQYLETLINAGVPGEVLLLLAVAITVWQLKRCLVKPTNAYVQAIGYGGLFVFISQLVHANFDFGLYLPANAFAFGIVLVGVSNAARSLNRDADSRPLSARIDNFFGKNQLVSIGGMLTTFVLLVFAVQELGRLAAVEIARADSQIAETPFSESATEPASDLQDTENSALPWLAREQPLSEDALNRAIRRLENTVFFRPYEGRLLLELAHLRLQLFRLRWYERAKVERPDADERQLWMESSLAVRYGQTKIMAEPERRQQLELPETKNCAEPAWQDLMASVRVSPLIGRTHLLIAEVARLLNKEVDGDVIERAVKLAGGESALVSEAGVLAAQDGDVKKAVAYFQRTIMIEPERLPEVVRFVRLLPGAPAADTYLPADPEMWLITAGLYQDNPVVRERLIRGALQLVSVQQDQLGPIQSLRLEARAMRMLGDLREARSALFAAVALKPADVKLRFELTGILIELKDFDEARAQLAILHLEIPKDPRVDAMFQRIKRVEMAEQKRRSK